MRRLGMAALLGTVTACSLFTSFGEYDGDENQPVAEGGAGGESSTASSSGSDGASPTTDSNAGDVIVLPDSGSDGQGGDGGGTQLVVNGGFETGGCAPFMYNPSKATIGASTNARTGTGACMVCNTGAPTGTAAIWQDFAQGSVGPGKYTFDAYVKTDGDAGNSLGQVQITVKTNVGGIRYPSSQTTTTTAGWAHLTVPVDVAADEFLSSILVGVYSDTTGPCVVFDDVSLVQN